MSEIDGDTPSTDQTDQFRYRPTADTAVLYRVIERSLNDIAWEGTHQANAYISLANIDRDKGLAVRYGHMVDALECMEIALTYMSQLRLAMGYRLHLEDEQNLPF